MSQHFRGKPSVLYENRFCDQNEFDIIINHDDGENKDATNSKIQIETTYVKCNIFLIPLTANHCFAKTAAIGSDMFVLNGSDKKVRKTCCVYVRSRSTWKNLKPMPDSRKYFSVCSFINSIYIISGYLDECGCVKGCFKYDTNHNKWTKIADLKIDRSRSTCAVFEGKIVATGGFRYNGITKSAESYDHHENKWSHFPDMIGWRDKHSSFSMGNKFFFWWIKQQ